MLLLNQSTLTTHDGLSEMIQFRATMNNDDVLAIWHRYRAIGKDCSPVERQGLHYAPLIIPCASASARPGTMIKRGGYQDESDALKYKDIKVHVVRDQDNPVRKPVLILITLRLLKGYSDHGAL